ncbi:hypothetical protein ACIRPX_43160 [Streptomyces sp. NPDC101225]|uniref:hypothetical protein n=1 Tax=Streptomyces sp. NPDC101225 TaxID=3366135 RepID=UPI003821745E
MIMRWLMTLGERTRPDTPTYAERPGPREARAIALADDCGQLFPILQAWRGGLGHELTAWAAQVDADNVANLPQEITGAWDPALRLDTMPGGYVKVSDYHDHQPRYWNCASGSASWPFPQSGSTYMAPATAARRPLPDQPDSRHPHTSDQDCH